MKLSLAFAAATLLALALLGGCNKSSGASLLDHSKKSGALQTQPAKDNGELTQGTPPAGGTAPPPATDNSGGSSGGSSSGGGGDKGGGSDDEGEG